MKKSLRRKKGLNKLKNINLSTSVKDCIGIIVVFLLINFIIVLNIKMVGIIPDEINTLAIPAILSGDKWNLNGYAYYGWGGVIFYYPLFKLIKDPILLYQSIVILNSILLSIIPCTIYIILEKFFEVNNRKIKLLISFFLGIYPGTFSISQYGWNEIWVRVIIWIILFILLRLIYGKKEKKDNLILGMLIAYAYAIHGRMIVLVPIMIIIYFFLMKVKKKEILNAKYILIGFLVIFIIDSFIKKRLQTMLFGKGIIPANTFLDMMNRIQIIFNMDVVISILRAISSYTFYLSITSFGIVVLAFFLLIKLLKNCEREDIGYITIGLFSILGVIFSMITASLFFSNNFNKHGYFIYGRYMDNFTSIIILFVFILIIKKKIHKKLIYQTISFILVHTTLTLLLENNRNVEPVDVNAATLLSFTKKLYFETPEQFYIINLFLIILSIYILVILKKDVYTALLTGILVYTISNYNLIYYRIEKSTSTFSKIENKYKIINIIKDFQKEKLSLNFITNGEIYPEVYLMLLNGIDTEIKEVKVKENILLKKEDLSIVNNDRETLMLDKDIYKLDVKDKKSNYSLFYRGDKIKTFLDKKNIVSNKNNIYKIFLDKMSITDPSKKMNDGIITKNNIMFGPYIELRPNHYKVIISGEGLNKDNVSFIIAGKTKNESKSTVFNHVIIKRDFEQYIVEFNIGEFVKDFETVMINKSNDDILIKSIKIIAE